MNPLTRLGQLTLAQFRADWAAVPALVEQRQHQREQYQSIAAHGRCSSKVSAADDASASGTSGSSPK